VVSGENGSSQQLTRGTAAIAGLQEGLDGIPRDWVKEFWSHRSAIPDLLPKHARALAQWIHVVADTPPTVSLVDGEARTELRVFNLGELPISIHLMCLLDLTVVPCDSENGFETISAPAVAGDQAASFVVRTPARVGQSLALVWHIPGDEALPTSPASDGAVLVVERANNELPNSTDAQTASINPDVACGLTSITTDPADPSKRTAHVGREGPAWAVYTPCQDDSSVSRMIIWHGDEPVADASGTVVSHRFGAPVMPLAPTAPETRVQVAAIVLNALVGRTVGEVRWSNVVIFS